MLRGDESKRESHDRSSDGDVDVDVENGCLRLFMNSIGSVKCDRRARGGTIKNGCLVRMSLSATHARSPTSDHKKRSEGFLNEALENAHSRQISRPTQISACDEVTNNVDNTE